MARQYIIGDIHGCWDELRDLLDRLSPANGERIVALGDVVDRGPASERVLEFLRDRGDATSLLGNHERKHLRSARGPVRPALSQRIVREELGERYDGWLDFLETFPRFLELPEAICVHGFFEPGIPLVEQREEVVVGVLSAERRLRESLPGPWYEHYRGDKPLVVGHHHYRGDGRPLVHDGLVYGLDTGCVHGFALTALVLPELELVSVRSRGDHWREQKRRYRYLGVEQVQTAEDLEWEVLRKLAHAPARAKIGSRRWERAGQAAELLARGEEAAEAIVTRARRVTDGVLRGLAAAPDWHECTERERAARFARGVAEYSWKHLLFQAYRGSLGADELLARRRTPRELFALAAVVGVTVEQTRGRRIGPSGSGGGGRSMAPTNDGWSCRCLRGFPAASPPPHGCSSSEPIPSRGFLTTPPSSENSAGASTRYCGPLISAVSIT